MMNKYVLHFVLVPAVFFFAVSSHAQVTPQQINQLLDDSVIRTGFTGISIYEPATGEYLLNYNAEKNFLPSSNVKLFTLYAGLKYLKDSITAIRFTENDSTLVITGTGDPTFLHADFADQRLYEFLKATGKKISAAPAGFDAAPYAPGWAWDDYTEDFMAERSPFPVYGNTVTYVSDKHGFRFTPALWNFQIRTDTTILNDKVMDGRYYRNKFDNKVLLTGNQTKLKPGTYQLPFITSDSLSFDLLADTLHKTILIQSGPSLGAKNSKRLMSRPVDSLFRPMMYKSDNFFAEQTLLMVSDEKLGRMNDQEIIDSLLQNEFKDIPTKPRWVDGSGLSRYNLFSPKDFVYILEKLRKDFGWQRIKKILPTGGQGTLTNYYETDAGFIFAKTGSMSNNVSLSGYLITKQNRTLVFSVLINNFSGSGRDGRRAIEKFIKAVRDTN